MEQATDPEPPGGSGKERRRRGSTRAKLTAAIWTLYGDLKTYCQCPTPQRQAALTAEFDRIFTLKTGFVALDRLLGRLHANKTELLMVLERRKSRRTPTDRKTTSAARSPDAGSAPAPAAMPVAPRATPSSRWPRPAPSSASAFGTTSAQGSLSPAQPSSRRFPS